ncbi:flagellar hook-length control protein FliK [Chitinimonas sp.]|uniref:flagellar hook-length control protein FliK n=1 Tax=Chitinimonas sp. TaxID=1934313 RepID=UPI002F94BC14
MPSTNTANNSLQALLQSTTKAPAAGRGDDASGQLFEASLSQRLQVHQSEQMARAAEPAKQEVSPAKPAQANQSKPADEPANKAEQAKPAEQDKAPEHTKEASKDAAAEGKSVKDKPADKDAEGQDDAQPMDAAQQAAAAMAALLAQLQSTQPADVPPPAEAAAAAAALGDALQSDGKTFTLPELAAKLASGRQALPGDAVADLKQLATDAAADPLAGQGKIELGKELLATSQAATDNFAQLLDQRIQSGAAAAAGQQLMSPIARTDVGRGQSLENARPTFSLQHPVGGEGWDKALGNKVIMMVSNQNQEVEMHLNPPHLGPMEVKLSLNQDQATLTFVAAQQPVRDALQASLPKLSEMLAESGIQLAQANVQSQSSSGGQERDSGSGRQAGRGRVDGVEETQSSPAAWRARVPVALPGNVNLFV